MNTRSFPATRLTGLVASLVLGLVSGLAAAQELSADAQPAFTSYDSSTDEECCCSCPPIGDVMLESIFGHPDPDCWTPLTLSTLFSEGWRQPWVPSPNGSGGAPRQGWINAADGNFYRLNFFTFAQGFNNPPQGNAYLGGYTLYTPFSRRLLLITNVPFVMRNNASNGLPTIDPTLPGATQSQTTFGDISLP